MRIAISALLLIGFSVSATAQDLNPMAIVAGHEGLSPTVPNPLSAGRHWVLLGAVGEAGVLEKPDAASCAATSVAFTLSVPEKPGGAPLTDSVRAVAVPWSVLQSWGATDDRRRAFGMVAFRLRSGDADSLYCVASTTPRLEAGTTAEQRVTARLLSDGSGRVVQERAAFAEAGQGALVLGGAFEFAPQRVLAPVRAQMGILVGSSRHTYGFAGTLMDSTHAVLLAARETDGSNWRHPTTSECLSTKVEFELRAPEKAGVAPVKTIVNAFWEDTTRTPGLFPETAQDTYGRVSSHSSVTAFCIAEVPLMLSEAIGVQRVTAAVVVTDTSPQVLLGSRRVPALPETNQHFPFKPIRAHARPRPVFGVIASLGGPLSIETTRTPVTETVVETVPQDDGTTITTTRVVPVDTTTTVDRDLVTLFGGFDFALEPVAESVWLVGPVLEAVMCDPAGSAGFRLCVPRSTRLVVGINLSGEVGSSVYVGISTASLSGMAATTSAIDLSVGVAARRDDLDSPMLTGSLTIDLGGTLATLREVLTN